MRKANSVKEYLAWKDMPIAERCRIGAGAIVSLISRVETAEGKIEVVFAMPPYRNNAGCLEMLVYKDKGKVAIRKELSAVQVRQMADALTEYADAWEALPKNEAGSADVDFDRVSNS